MCASILTLCGSVAAASPVANFTSNVTHGIAPLSVQFIDTSTGNVTSWSWNFGNGATSTQQNPTYTYIYAGKYNVIETVTVVGIFGFLTQLCFEKNITVLPNKKTVGTYNKTVAGPPVANFTSNVTHGTVPLKVQFIDTSTGNVTSWSWNFGNGATSTQQNPTYTYKSYGKYSVTETVYGSNTENSYVKIIAVLLPYKTVKIYANEIFGGSIHTLLQSKYITLLNNNPNLISISSNSTGKYTQGSNITINTIYSQLSTNRSSLNALLNNNVTALLNNIKSYILEFYKSALEFANYAISIYGNGQIVPSSVEIENVFNGVYQTLYHNIL